MIFDHILKLGTYRNLPHIGEIEEYLKATDVTVLEAGKYTVCEGVTVSVNLYEPKVCPRWESHEKFIDLQYLVTGAEDMVTSALCDMSGAEAYNKAKDIRFYEASSRECVYHMRSGDFALLYPQDAHQPGKANAETSGEVRKLVFKIPFEE